MCSESELHMFNQFKLHIKMNLKALFVSWSYLKRRFTTPQAPDKFNPKVNLQTCGIIQMLYETKQIETMTFGKSVIALFSKIEPKTSK